MTTYIWCTTPTSSHYTLVAIETNTEASLLTFPQVRTFPSDGKKRGQNGSVPETKRQPSWCERQPSARKMLQSVCWGNMTLKSLNLDSFGHYSWQQHNYTRPIFLVFVMFYFLLTFRDSWKFVWKTNNTNYCCVACEKIKFREINIWDESVKGWPKLQKAENPRFYYSSSLWQFCLVMRWAVLPAPLL